VAGCEHLASRVAPQRRIVITETTPDCFALTAPGDNERSGEILHHHAGDGEPAPVGWRAALKGAHVELRLRPQRFVSKEMSLPAQARSFLPQIVANQIDRLTPWTREQALFGYVERGLVDSKLIVLLAATDRRRLSPLLEMISGLNPASLLVVASGLGDDSAPPVPMASAGGGLGVRSATLRRALAIGLVGVWSLIPIDQAYVAWRTMQIRDEAERVESETSRLRASLLRPGVTADEGQALFHRKLAGPFATVMVDRLAKVLPDDTYLTDLEFDGSKLRIAGLSPDATRLIDLLEKSGNVFDVSFYAPTTRSRSSARERFFIEASIGPRVGEKT
jgi:general secretion pathway protein L